MKFPTPAEPWDSLPDELKFEMMLEMLVDDELPEAQRAKLLASLDAMPDKWRDLALRFLERQAEHTSVKEFIAGIQDARSASVSVGNGAHNISAAPQTSRSAAPSQYRPWRIAAGLLLLAGISASLIILQKNQTNSPAPIATEVVTMPGKVLGAANETNVSVNLVKTGQMPSNLMNSELGNNASRRIYIVPQGDDKAAVIPVTVNKPEVIY